MGKIKDLTGQKFGSLTVLEITNERKNRQVVWKCQCDCGNITYVVGEALRTGHTKTCGCSWYQQRAEDLTNQVFGQLTVLKRNEELHPSDRASFWDCKCNCGNTRTVRSSLLKSGKILACQNCQTIKSLGENEIVNILNQNNITYKREVTFEDLISPKNSKLFFDFVIYDTDYQEIKYIIEYDGIQHFKPIDYFGGIENFKYQQKCDELKNIWCKKHNIKLIRIPYTQQGKITLEVIQNGI